MAVLTPSNKFGTLNGTTSVDLVAAPAASTQRLVRTVTIYNADTAAVTVTIRLTNSGAHYKILTQTLAPGESLIFGNDGEILVLDATTESITCVMSAAPAATQPDYCSFFADNA